jgi:hypothetical protein
MIEISVRTWEEFEEKFCEFKSSSDIGTTGLCFAAMWRRHGHLLQRSNEPHHATQFMIIIVLLALSTRR